MFAGTNMIKPHEKKPYNDDSGSYRAAGYERL